MLDEQMRDVPLDGLRTLAQYYRVLLYAGNFDGSSCNHLGVARVIDQIDPAFGANAARVVWRDAASGAVTGWVKRRTAAVAAADAAAAVAVADEASNSSSGDVSNNASSTGSSGSSSSVLEQATSAAWRNLMQIVLHNAGHLVPTDQPAAALDMIRKFVFDDPFGTEGDV